MSEEKKDQDVTATEPTPEASGVEAPVAESAKMEPIKIELEDLTEEGKKKTEEALGRSVADIEHTVASQEDRPGSVVALRFETSREAYEAEQARLLNDLRKEAVLPGFRKGKAPLKLLQIRLGEDAVRDTIRAIGSNVLRQETIKQGLKFITKPQIVTYTVPEDGGTVSFEVEGEVEPKVEVKQYKGITVEATVRPVTDEMVEEKLQGLRRQNAVMETAGEDAAINPDDAIVVDIVVTNALGEKLDNYCKENQLIQNFKQELPEKVSAELVGKKVGETVTTTVEHKSTNRRGEEVTHEDNYAVTVREIKISRLPVLDDEFAKDLGDNATLEDLRQKTRKELEESQAQRERAEALHKLYHQLVELNPVDPPASLLEQQAYRMIMEDQYQLSRMGIRLEHVVQDVNKYLNDQRSSAGETVKVQLLLAQIGKLENLEVTDADVDKEIEEMAEKMGRKPLAIRARLEAQKQLDQFREQVAQRKLGDFLLANNTVVKVEAAAQEAPAEEEGTTEV